MSRKNEPEYVVNKVSTMMYVSIIRPEVEELMR